MMRVSLRQEEQLQKGQACTEVLRPNGLDEREERAEGLCGVDLKGQGWLF